MKADYLSLSHLTVLGALEIDLYIRGQKNDFQVVKDFAETLRRTQLKDTDNAITAPEKDVSFYLSLNLAMKSKSQKELKNFQQTALEMRLLQAEIDNISLLNPNNPRDKERLDNLLSFFCDMSKETLRYVGSFKKYCA